MKASNILLVIMLSMFLTAVIGSDLVLKKRFDLLDRKDPFTGYKGHSVEPFRYVKLQGQHFGFSEISYGEDYEIKSILDQKNVSWKVVNDTLIVKYDKELPQGSRFNENIFYSRPAVYILTPKLDGLESNEIICKIKGFKGDKLQVKQHGGAIMLSENQVTDLDAQFSAGTIVKLNGMNQFGKGKVVVMDSSNFQVDQDIFESLDLEVSNSARVNLPGSLLRKL
ncbi:hypothetical protein [Dyadobacter fanqingshengii]|uniref:Uncharacterized protein n=1 Tax=Dyadobacter fanqingshengii TaxID=2906443 RepID=A0A9X1P6H9_9BACT|nr:hypothetical protein [Dyadobacter fanqingshengii]MCF0039646.1 hypothetical protein [Dyadobacter fanqingshengii]USJ38588.1 hypothetical protein NFI81_12570 [Dyadobacter fanqingshengii]